MPVTAIKQFLKLEAAGGIVLVGAAALAMIMANSVLGGIYEAVLEIPVAIQIGALVIAKPLLLWVNDGLMAVFFFLVGLEIKREVLQGELSSLAQASLPVVAAVGGMLVPALIYVLFNLDDGAARSRRRHIRVQGRARPPPRRRTTAEARALAGKPCPDAAPGSGFCSAASVR